MTVGRFACASSGLGLASLLRGGRGTLVWGVGLAVALHLGLTQVADLQEEQRVVRPLTTQFIKRQPRLSKPLELKKRPAPRQRRMHREMIAAKARTDRAVSVLAGGHGRFVRSLAKPQATLGRAVSVGMAAVEPKIAAQAIRSGARDKETVNMALEMVDVEALDTGQYHAMVIQDPSDRRNVRGFFHLAVVYSTNMPVDPVYHRRFFWPYAVPNLVDAMNRYTKIKTDLTGRHTFDSAELFKTPWVLTYVANGTFRMTNSEALSLGRYFFEGGFVVFDPGHHRTSPRSVCLRRVAKDALGTRNYLHGRDWDFEVLQDFSHPLFHCYFDFPEGPPVGCGSVKTYDEPLEGVFIEDRLVAVVSYINLIGWWDMGTQRERKMDGTRAFQFGVNLIIFALTQEGSITNRVMDAVRH